jgi:hypothetical protein
LLLVGVPLLTSKVTVPAALGWWRDATLEVLRAIVRLF